MFVSASAISINVGKALCGAQMRRIGDGQLRENLIFICIDSMLHHMKRIVYLIGRLDSQRLDASAAPASEPFIGSTVRYVVVENVRRGRTFTDPPRLSRR